jgi:cytochrome b6-f complex iron-sulfur subunit
MTATISTGLIVAIAAFIVLDIFVIQYGIRAGRTRRAQEAEAKGLPTPPAKPVKSVSRRDFYRGSLLVSLLVFGAQFGGATVAFLWPNLKGGFGSLITAGTLTDIKAQLLATQQPVYFGQGRFYIVPYDGKPTPEADYAAEGVTAEGIMPLYQRCVHLGCRVPFCTTSQWFECPCHGSKYNGAGEYKLGPAPRGMDRFTLTITAGIVKVDTSKVVLGPPRGTNTTGQVAEGPFCVAPG